MKKFIEFLKQWWATFPKDKLYHFLAGYFLASLFGITISPAIGFAVAFIAGLAKEIYDKSKGGAFDFADLFATILGGGLAAVLLVIFGA